MKQWALIFILLAIFQTSIVAQTPESGSASIAELDLAQRHHTIVYSLPRIGLTNSDDCFLDIYQDELERDMALIKQMGAETVFLFCPWSTETDITHTAFLNILIKYNMSFIDVSRSEAAKRTFRLDCTPCYKLVRVAQADEARAPSRAGCAHFF